MVMTSMVQSVRNHLKKTKHAAYWITFVFKNLPCIIIWIVPVESVSRLRRPKVRNVSAWDARCTRDPAPTRVADPGARLEDTWRVVGGLVEGSTLRIPIREDWGTLVGKIWGITTLH